MPSQADSLAWAGSVVAAQSLTDLGCECDRMPVRIVSGPIDCAVPDRREMPATVKPATGLTKSSESFHPWRPCRLFFSFACPA
jgi:hypothetical protein